MVILTFSCPDKKGIVASVSKILFENDANIIESNQYSTNTAKNPHFFMRIVFEQDNAEALKKIETEVKIFAVSFNVDYYKISDASIKKNAAVLVSKEDHCLYELLWQQSSGDVFLNIPCIFSNHNTLSSIAKSYNIPFKYIPNHISREESERLIIEELGKLNVDIDFIILAKYMKILSGYFINSFGNKIINIHHSFLPSFPGANPYRQAFGKGVKLVGATAHFVNEKLDDGPIIEQDIIRISHGDDETEIRRKGKIVERLVLAKAVKFFTEDRIIEHNSKTIIFD